MHGSVTLANGSTDRNFHFYWDPAPADGIWFGGQGQFEVDRYRHLSVLGRATLTVWASGGTHSWISGSLGFNIQRRVSFSAFNASPEPVRKGSPLKLTGTLRRVGFYASGEAVYVPLAGKPVDLYYIRDGWSQDHFYTSTTTNSTGNFTKTVTATYDACWKPISPQSDRYVRRYSAFTDCVDVR